MRIGGCSASFGLIGAQFSPERGGFGDDPIDTIIIFESLGRGLVVEPLIDSALLAGSLFKRGADSALTAAWLPDLISGRKTLALRTSRAALTQQHRVGRDPRAFEEWPHRSER